MSCVNITKNKVNKCNTSVSALADEIKFLSGLGWAEKQIQRILYLAKQDTN